MKGQQTGRVGEELAAKWLEQQGYRILHRNFRFDRGEVDLIAEDGGELVFIEVKTRRGVGFGTPEEAVTPAKEEQMNKVAEGYLLKHGLEQQACRFDIVSIVYKGSDVTVSIIKNAFV